MYDLGCEAILLVTLDIIVEQVTRHDIKDRKAMGKMSEAYPHLILDNFTTKVLKYFALSFVLKRSFRVSNKRVLSDVLRQYI